MDEQKEWWLPLNTLIINSDEKRPNGIHVIEHSAYLSLELKLKVAVDALKFYADENNMKEDCGAYGNIKFYDENYEWGKAARDALSKIEDIK